MQTVFVKSQQVRMLLLFCAPVLLLAAIPLSARSNYRIQSWTTADGLPQNTINRIVQTRDGYLWIATFGGLVRFDGVRFTVFNTVNAPALKSSRVTALYEDRAGILWAATETGEISCLRDGEFYSFDDGEEEEINSLLVDSRGFLWAGGGHGARRYRLPENACGVPVHAFERITPPPLNNRSSNQIGTILEAADGSIWLNNFGVGEEKPGRVLHRRENQQLEVFEVANASIGGQKRTVSVTDIALAADANGRETLWIADYSGLLRLDGGRFIKGLAQNEFGDERVKFARDRNGHLIANVSGGIAHLAANDHWQVSTAPEIAGKKSRALFSDREGNLWLGTNADGLLCLKPNFVEFYDKSKGVAENQTAAVLEDSSGSVWIAGYGLQRYENGRFVSENGAPQANLLALAELRDGTMFVGGYDTLFARRADGSFKDLSSELKEIFGSESFAVKAILEDSRGNLWLGFRDKGVLRRKANGKYQRYTNADGLVGNQVQFITETRDGAIWFGILGGASRFADGRFTNFTTADGFAGDNIRAILETADGNLYFGTYGGGLSRLKTGLIRTVTTRDGLFDDIVSRIIADDGGNFWMLGNAGIFTARKTDLDAVFDGTSDRLFCRSFGTADGMPTAEGNGGSQPAGWLARDGRLWFPTIRGYVRLAPPAPENFLPPAVIEEVRLNNKIVDTREQITVNPNDRNLEIRYTGLSFNHSEQLRFRYQLEGFDQNWVETGTRRTVYFASLPQGEFIFRVQAANADGVWSDQAATLRLKVLPPFYRTWWFYGIIICGVIGAVYLIDRLRVSRLRRARHTREIFSRRLIQVQEEERKRIAGDLHDSLSQNLVIIKNRAMFFLQERDDPEGVFEPIEEIAEAAQESLEEVREIASNLRPFQIDRLGLTKAIEALARKTDQPNLRVTADVENIDSLLAPEMEINLYRVIQEGLNNIVKHSGANEASIQIERLKDAIKITIRDNGKGFDLEAVNRAEQESKGGFGLMGIYERTRILGTVPIIKSSADAGTVIFFTVAVKITDGR